MIAKKWRYLPEFLAALMVPIIYFVMTKVGMDSGDAQVYSAAVGAIYFAVVLWWRGQAPLVDSDLPNLTVASRLVRALLVMFLAFIAETITAELVLDIAFQALQTANATVTDKAEVRRVVNRYFAIPIGLCFIFALGFWAAKLLPVRRPLLWIAGIVLTWYAIRFSLYGLARQLGNQEGVDLPPVGQALLQTVPVMLLSYAAMIIGNFFGRRRYGRRKRKQRVSDLDP